jgi:tRNA(Arg) A34 adenosine deaminase TadA
VRGGQVSRRALVAGSLLAGLAAPIVTAGVLEARRLERLSSQDSLPPAVRARLVPAMREAIAEARLAYLQFGAVLLDVDSGQTVYRAHNTGVSGDPTAHAEMNLLRGAGLAGLDLARTVVVTTAECCPMCAAAAVWASVAGVAFGTSIATTIRYGWGQVDIPMTDVLARSTFSQIPVVGGILAEETDPLYAAGEPPPRPRSS